LDREDRFASKDAARDSAGHIQIKHPVGYLNPHLGKKCGSCLAARTFFFICSGNLPRHARASITHIVAYGQIKVCEEKNKKVSISTIATLSSKQVSR
jgi:hypothetical protein